MPQDNSALCGRQPGHRKQDEGQALAEYSLILAFVAVACILALTALGIATAGELDRIAASFP